MFQALIFSRTGRSIYRTPDYPRSQHRLLRPLHEVKDSNLAEARLSGRTGANGEHEIKIQYQVFPAGIFRLLLIWVDRSFYRFF